MEILKYKTEKEYAQILEIVCNASWFSSSCSFSSVFIPHWLFQPLFWQTVAKCWERKHRTSDQVYGVPGMEENASQTEIIQFSFKKRGPSRSQSYQKILILFRKHILWALSLTTTTGTMMW